MVFPFSPRLLAVTASADSRTPPARPAPTRPRPPRPALLPAVAMVLLGAAAVGWQVAEFLGDPALANTLISPTLRDAILAGPAPGGVATVRTGACVLTACAAGVVVWLLLGGLVARVAGCSARSLWARWGVAGWAWWLAVALFPLGDLATAALDSRQPDTHWQAWWRGVFPFYSAHLVAGWLATLVALALDRRGIARPAPSESQEEPVGSVAASVAQPVPQASRTTRGGGGLRKVPVAVWLAVAAYTLLFGWMNWRLYDSLMLPHGDSAMYEEHLWNLLHGNGFRSWLDNGRLFLGEHIQVVHLAAIPVYLIWPSHVLLEWLQTLALALGAIPLYRITCRATGSRGAGGLLAVAYLFAFPLQFLDIAIDFKTFRPNSFEIPFLLAALDALECRRWWRCGGWCLATLTCQEDAATVLGPLGLWVACCWPAGAEALSSAAETAAAQSTAGPSSVAQPSAAEARASQGEPGKLVIRLAGLAVAGLSVVYVAAIIRVILPWFRGGADVHFAQYFTELGESSGGIAATLLRHPELVWQRLCRAESGLFAIGLLAPFGWLAGLSPSRALVAAPLFVVLCLSDITDSPQHHFHAPLVPVLAWAAAHGLARARDLLQKQGPGPRVALAGSTSVTGQRNSARLRACPVEAIATWGLVSSVVTGFWVGLSPLAIAFWDPGSPGHWQKRYVATERSRHIEAVVAAIPRTARVASTDYVHPRFTHHERSYDYSDYRPVVPPDCEYIVIDLRGPGSQIVDPSQIKELREQPPQWRLLPDQTGGYFAILQRLGPASDSPAP